MQAILFDIGGVVIDDHCLRQRAREALGISDADAFWQAFNEAALPACRGEEPLAEAWRRVGRSLGVSVTEEIARSLWNDDYEANIKVNHELLEFVDQLGLRYQTGVISNTVAEHARVLRSLGVYDHFNDVVLSHEVGITKDSPQIFDLALERLKLPASEVVFIDDVERFRAVAEAQGMQGVLYRDLQGLKEEIAKLESGVR